MTYQIPTGIERRFRVSCDIPEGPSMAISPALRAFGPTQGPAKLPVASCKRSASRRSGLILISERLVVIRPRRVAASETGGRPPIRLKIETKRTRSLSSKPGRKVGEWWGS